MIRKAMAYADELKTLGHTPREVVTASQAQAPGWAAAHDALTAHSTNGAHRFLPKATHSMVVEDETTARTASQAIIDVVSAVRTNATVAEQHS